MEDFNLENLGKCSYDTQHNVITRRKVGVKVLRGTVRTFHLAPIMKRIPRLFQFYL